MFIGDEKDETRVNTVTALRHVLVFQLKLAADALRDFLMSPLSVLAFVLDAIRQPKFEDSLYLRLMLFGRRSDRWINLFEEYRDSGAFTIDRAVDDLEGALRSATEVAGERRADRPVDDARPERDSRRGTD